MSKEQTNEAFAARSDEAEESNLRAQDVAQDASLNASRSNELPIESRLATWHSSNDSRRDGSVGSLGFASHGSQRDEKIYRFPRNGDNWIRTWIEQCDFGVTAQEQQRHFSEDRISHDEIDATYAPESRSPKYDQASLDVSWNDEKVPFLDSLLGPSLGQCYSLGMPKRMERLGTSVGVPRQDAVVKNSLLSRLNASYPPRPSLQSARGSNYSLSAASATYANDAYPNVNSDHRSQAFAGSRASLDGSQASSAGSSVSLTGSHTSLAGSQSSRKGKRKASDVELHDRAAPPGRLYQCTWCFKAFRRPQEWHRHERAVHFVLKGYVCMPDLQTAYRFGRCAFCGSDERPFSHLGSQHGTSVCLIKSLHERTFPRKDGLVQHIKRSHAEGLLADPNKLAEYWTMDGVVGENDPYWECGFCGKDNMSWPERYKHVAAHFKHERDMREWVGRHPEDGKYYCYTDFEPNRRDLPCQRTSIKQDVQFQYRNELVQHLFEHHNIDTMDETDTYYLGDLSTHSTSRVSNAGYE